MNHINKAEISFNTNIKTSPHHAIFSSWYLLELKQKSVVVTKVDFTSFLNQKNIFKCPERTNEPNTIIASTIYYIGKQQRHWTRQRDINFLKSARASFSALRSLQTMLRWTAYWCRSLQDIFHVDNQSLGRQNPMVCSWRSRIQTKEKLELDLTKNTFSKL